MLLGNLGRSGAQVFGDLLALRRLRGWLDAQLQPQVGNLVLLKVGDAKALPPCRRAGQGTEDELEGAVLVEEARKGLGTPTLLFEAAFDEVRGAHEFAVGRRQLQVRQAGVQVTNDEQRTPKELFLAYRGQVNVEAAFRWLKGPVRVSPVFLKTPERVEAFGYVMLMAYLVYALVQRAVRRALPEGEKLEVEGRKTDRPTAQTVLDVIAHAKVLHVLVSGERLRRIFLAPTAKIRRIMELLEIPADAFLTLPELNTG